MYLVLLAGEVVSALCGARHTVLQACIAAVIGGEDGVLEAAGVFELQLQLAELSAVGGGDVGAGLHYEVVEGEGDCGFVVGEETLDGLVGATRAAICDTCDLDLVLGWLALVLGDWSCSREGGKSEDCGGVLHFDWRLDLGSETLENC